MGRRLSHDEAAQVMRAAGLEPLEPYPGATTKWRCRHDACGQEITPRYSDVRQGGGGCIYCRPANVAAAQRADGAAAEAVMRASGFEPLEPYPGSNNAWRCRCVACGRESSPRYDGVARRGRGCKFCAGIAVDPDEAREAAIALGLEPLMPYPGVTKLWACRCAQCDRIVEVLYRTLAKGKTGCPYCVEDGRFRRVDPDEARREFAEIGLETIGPYPGADTPWPYRCTRCGHEGAMSRTSVRNGAGCMACGRERTATARRLDAEAAATFMRERGVEPLEPYRSAISPWLCRCLTCENTITPAYNTVQQGGTPCRFCAWGSMSGRPAVLYLVVHEELDAAKVGIGRAGSGRVQRWERKGWTHVRSWELDDGDVAREVESAALRYWREELGAPVAVEEHELEGMAGWTETAPLWAIDLDETVARIEELLQE